MPDARFRRTAGGVSSLGLHAVWCPKYRKRVLGGRVVQRLNELLDEIGAENGWQIVAREVMSDHVRILARIRPTDSPAEVARKCKGRTSRLLRAELPWLTRPKVPWSKSYFIASVGYVSEEIVRRYIEHQWDDAA
ncbi:MAG: IS200/IS605 family transposase [Actinomycetota bacterium]|nr:IS200/IS605 family transposase [Actinomycetota bacterium]